MTHQHIEHGIVYAEHGMYAGWPANHGAWQWGDELLVGFIRGKYGSGSMHNVVGSLKKMQARSRDGGRTWTVEDPGVDFEAAFTVPPPAFDLRHDIIRCCGVYDHGGDDCDPGGGFYVSSDRGRSWHGAYAFAGIEDQFGTGDIASACNTSRTAVLGDLVFMSANMLGYFGTDHVIVARHTGTRFEWVGDCEDEVGRVVMPAPVAPDLNKTRGASLLVMACRRRGCHRRDCWIDAYASHDHGATWAFLAKVGDTGSHNGNPPALIESNARLVCAFANRDDQAMCISVSDDLGHTWSERMPIRSEGKSDIGYPRLLHGADGELVCVYYWADAERPHQHIAFTRFSV